MKRLLILAALVAAPLSAQAETPRTTRIEVSSVGLDLTNPTDAAAMILRIEAAVRPACVAPGFASGRTTARCIREVTADAIKKLQIPELHTAFQRRSAPGGTVAQG